MAHGRWQALAELAAWAALGHVAPAGSEVVEVGDPLTSLEVTPNTYRRSFHHEQAQGRVEGQEEQQRARRRVQAEERELFPDSGKGRSPLPVGLSGLLQAASVVVHVEHPTTAEFWVVRPEEVEAEQRAESAKVVELQLLGKTMESLQRLCYHPSWVHVRVPSMHPCASR